MNNTTDEVTALVQEKSIYPVVYVIGVTCSTWTICANLFILWCFIRNRRRKWTHFSRQTCSMTISDLLVGFTGIPFLIIEQDGRHVDKSVCLTTFYLLFSIQCVTLLHVLGICILRNIKLKTMNHAFETSRFAVYANCIIVIAWVLAMGMMLIPIALWRRRDDNPSLCYLSTVFGSDHRKAMVYIGSFYLSAQGLTNGIYLFTCCRIWKELRQIVPIDGVDDRPSVPAGASTVSMFGRQTTHVTFLATLASVSNTQGSSVPMPMPNRVLPILRSQKQVICTIGILLLMFNVFTLPATLAMLYVKSKPSDPDVRFLVCSLFMINSGINPIVYATRVASLRNAAKKLFREIVAVIRF